MNIVFFSNLDDVQDDVRALNGEHLTGNKQDWTAPAVGNRFRFSFPKWVDDTNSLNKVRETFTYYLEVVSVIYDVKDRQVEVELHIPSTYKDWSIAKWSEWLKQHRDRS